MEPYEISCIDAIASATENLSDDEAQHISKAMQYIWGWKDKNKINDLKQAIKHLEKIIDKYRLEEIFEKYSK